MANNQTGKLLAIAIGLGVAGAALSLLYLKARESDLIDALKPKSEPVAVVVAARDLVKGDRLDNTTLSVREIPAEYVDPNAINPDQFDSIEGEILVQNLASGKPLLRSFIGREFPLDFSDTIPRKRRAMTIQIDETNSISGLIRPGNRIDVFVNLPPSTGDSNNSKGNEVVPVLENVEVLATGRDAARDYEEKVRLLRVGYGTQPDQNYSTITLNVTPREAGLLTLAQDKGDLLALLRNRKDVGGSGFTTVSTATIRSNAAAMAAAARARTQARTLDGELKTDANGNIITASGIVLKGARLREDGKLVLADGTVVDPNDVIINADGTVTTKDGTILAGVSAGKVVGKLRVDENGNVITADGVVLQGATLRADGKLVLADGTVIDPNDVIINADGTITTRDGELIEGLVADNSSTTGNTYEIDYIVGGVSEDGVATVNKVPVVE